MYDRERKIRKLNIESVKGTIVAIVLVIISTILYTFIGGYIAEYYEIPGPIYTWFLYAIWIACFPAGTMPLLYMKYKDTADELEKNLFAGTCRFYAVIVGWIVLWTLVVVVAYAMGIIIPEKINAIGGMLFPLAVVLALIVWSRIKEGNNQAREA